MERTSNNFLRLLQRCGQMFVIALMVGVMLTTSAFAEEKSGMESTPKWFDNAQYLASGSTVSGALSRWNTSEYYRINVPSRQKVVINCSTSFNQASLYIYNSKQQKIYDRDMTPVNSSYSSAGTCTYSNTLDAGTYYVVPTSGASYAIIDYKLSFKLQGAATNQPAGLTAPGNLKVVGKDYKTVRVSWNKVNNVSGYYVYVSNKLNGNYKKCATIEKNTQTGVTLSNLVPGRSYYFKVQSYKGSKKSSFSGRKYGKTKESYANIKSLTTSGTSATLKWNKVPGANSYHILRAKGNGSFVDIKTISANSSSYKNTGLASGTRYRYSIRVCYKIAGKYYQGSRSSAKQITTSSSTKYRALLIGESDYSNAYASNLDGPVNDIVVMQKMLQGMKKPYAVTKKANQSKAQVMSAITSTFKGATSNDVSLFYYSGHGVTEDGYYSGALYTVDDDMITPRELATALKKVPGKVIVILDSCGSGAAVIKNGKAKAMDTKRFANSVYSAFAAADSSIKSGELATSKFVVICAATKGESSWDTGIEEGGSAGEMTYFLTKGAGNRYPNGSYSGSMPADTNKNGRLTLAEIYRYVDDNAGGDQTTIVYPSTTSGYNVFIRK